MTSPRAAVYPKDVARHPRIEIPNAVHYVTNRGNAGRPIFKGDEDRALFLRTLAEACGKTGWEALAWSLSPGAFHLLIRTPQPNLTAGMKWLLGAYTIRFNRRHESIGHLFAGRYRSVFVEPIAPFLTAVADFIHLTPAREGYSKTASLAEFPWSSLSAYALASRERQGWFNAAPLLGALELADDAAGRARMWERAEEARRAPANPLWAQVRRGWCVGSAEFRRQLLAQLAAPEANSAAPNREAVRARAEALVAEELRRLGWVEKELAARPKGDPEKVRIGRKVRAATTVSLRWVAERLRMGSTGYAAARLAAEGETKTPPPVRRAAKPRAERRTRKPDTAPPPSSAAPEELPVHCL